MSAPRMLSPASGADDALADPQLLRELEDSLFRLQQYATNALSPATIDAYRSDWEHFAAWCSRYGRAVLPAEIETVGLYLGAFSEHLSLATLERRLASISAIHQEAGHASPASVSSGPLRLVWRGIVRAKTRRQGKAEPLLVDDLRLIVQSLPREAPSGELTLASIRDRAILLVGWAGALRRSEIVALQVSDLEFVAGAGVNLHIRRSKADQEGAGLIKGLPFGSSVDTCPVSAVRTWLQAARIIEGPVFRRIFKNGRVGPKALTDQNVSLILKKHARRVGLPDDAFSAHSLRSGFITQAIRAGKSERRVKEHSGHKSWETFNGYVKHAATFQSNPLDGIGL